MNILLDTQAFLWLISDDPQLSKKAKKLFLDQDNAFFLSVASMWEIAIKVSLGKMTLHQPIDKFIPTQLQENLIKQLTIDFKHIVTTTKLPFHHRDPFDRLIIAQAMSENLLLLSCDKTFDKYDVERAW